MATEKINGEWKEKIVEAEVLGKTIEERGLIIKRKAYVVALRIPELDINSRSDDVPFDEYILAEVGKKVRLKILYWKYLGSWRYKSKTILGT